MSICSCCQTEFDDSVELFPKLIVTRDERVARELMDDKAEVLLCMKCWFADVKRIPSEDLAMALMGLLKKVRGLEAAHPATGDWNEIIEKMKQGQKYGTPYINPSPYPGNPQWVDGTSGGTMPDGWSYTYSAQDTSDNRGLYVGTKGNIQQDSKIQNHGKSETNP